MSGYQPVHGVGIGAELVRSQVVAWVCSMARSLKDCICMKIYILKADPDSYQSLVLSLDEDNIWYRWLSGKPVAQEWPTPQVDVIYQDPKGKWLPSSDFPSFTVSHIPVFSARAVEILGELLTKNGELLPLNCIDGEYFAYNVLNLVSALDQEKSDIVRFSTGRIMTVRKYALYEDKLADQIIFKIPEIVLLSVFVTDRFKHKIEDAGLTGFCFTEI